MLGAATRIAYAIGLHRETKDLNVDNNEASEERAHTFW